MELLKNAYDGFWDESRWFPPGVNWTTLKSTPEEKYPEFCDLRLPFLYAFLLLGVRAAFEWSIARPLARLLGLKDNAGPLPNTFSRLVANFSSKFSSPVTSNESSVEVNGHLINSDADPSANAKQQRSLSSAAFVKFVPKSPVDKFSECCWRFTFYSFIFIYGSVVLWNKPWFWDTKHFWYGYPFQPISMDIYWYYMFEFSFYISLIFSQFFDVHRNDFWVFFVHHIVTVILLGFSYVDNFTRVGSLVMITHDAADPWLEMTKMARYCRKTMLSEICFCIFTAIWLLTRCCFLPFWIIYSTFVESVSLVGFYSAYYFFNGLLLSLQALHVLWTVIIIQGLIKMFKSGEFEDTRSDDEGGESENEDGGNEKND